MQLNLTVILFCALCEAGIESYPQQILRQACSELPRGGYASGGHCHAGWVGQEKQLHLKPDAWGREP